MSLRTTVTIATKNRLDDLRRTLSVVAQLDPAPDELLITADGCTDGTVDFVRTHYPNAELIVNETSRGSTGSRDTMFRRATGDLIVILDDDSYPLDGDFLARVPKFFEENPQLAVLTFPQRSNENSESLHATDFGPPQFVGTYVNCASVLRKRAFIELGGYVERFRIAYDEPDFALRCISAGWQIRFETSLTIRHHYSPAQRSEIRMHHMHARNELWSVFMRCPMPQLFAVALFRTARQLGYARKRGIAWLLREPSWWFASFAGLRRCIAERAPIPWVKYRRWMELVRRPIAIESASNSDR